MKGLITEDVSVPEQFGAVGMLDTVTDVMLLVAPAMRFLGKLGVSRALEAVDSVPGKAAQGDEKSKQLLKYLTIRNNFTKAVGNEYRSMKENAALTAKIGPPQVPVLVFVATGEGSAAKVSLMSCTSFALNWWWSAKVKGVICGVRGDRSCISCSGDAIPISKRML